MAVSPATLEYLKWSEVPIIFDRSDHSDFVPKLGLYPLIVSPIIKGVKLNQVIVDEDFQPDRIVKICTTSQSSSVSQNSPWSCHDPRRPDHFSRDLQNSGKLSY
jgi:hypothetical protein